MRLYLLETHSILRILAQQLADKIYNLHRHCHWEIQAQSQNFVVGFGLTVFGFEWGFTCAKLVAEDSQAPNVYLLIVEVPSDNFRRNIVQSSTERLSLVERRVN